MTLFFTLDLLMFIIKAGNANSWVILITVFRNKTWYFNTYIIKGKNKSKTNGIASQLDEIILTKIYDPRDHGIPLMSNPE